MRLETMPLNAARERAREEAQTLENHLGDDAAEGGPICVKPDVLGLRKATTLDRFVPVVSASIEKVDVELVRAVQSPEGWETRVAYAMPRLSLEDKRNWTPTYRQTTSVVEAWDDAMAHAHELYDL